MMCTSGNFSATARKAPSVTKCSPPSMKGRLCEAKIRRVCWVDALQSGRRVAEAQLDVTAVEHSAVQQVACPGRGCSSRCRRTRGGWPRCQSGYRGGRRWWNQRARQTARWRPRASSVSQPMNSFNIFIQHFSKAPPHKLGMIKRALVQCGGVVPAGNAPQVPPGLLQVLQAGGIFWRQSRTASGPDG